MSSHNMNGTAIFSIEIELAWGYHDLTRANKFGALSADRSTETDALERLLILCDKLDIPITFDIVGHLLLDECPGVHKGEYPNGWFNADPGTNTDTDPLFYAPDLIDRILEAETDHEICTHTFSHALGEGFSPAQLDDDLSVAQETHQRELGSRATSLVPPRHQSMDADVLKHNRIDVVRQTKGKMPDTRPALLYWYLIRNHPVVKPSHEDGLTTTYTSVVQSMTAPYIAHGQRDPPRFLGSVPLRVRKRFHRRYVADALDRAAESGAHAHFWTHLHDMANEPQLDVVEQVLRLTQQRRESGAITVSKMEELA